jgi:hypothetical protein
VQFRLVSLITTSHPSDRRRGQERRAGALRALLAGHWWRRRRGGRRSHDAHPAGRDWHAAHWLGVAVLLLLLSFADAILTLTLMRHGAVEANPLMAPLIEGGGPAFAYWKLGLTAAGVVVLTALAHIRLFGWMPTGCVLYLVLLGYVCLIAYEWQLLHHYGTSVVYSGAAVPLH